MNDEVAKFARECFGNFFTRGQWANHVMPTEEIEDSIQSVLRFNAAHPEIPNRRNFDDELTCLLNKYSKENGSNTPDFILAEYLNRCLESWNLTVQAREEWYGRKFSPGSLTTPMPITLHADDTIERMDEPGKSQ